MFFVKEYMIKILMDYDIIGFGSAVLNDHTRTPNDRELNCMM